MRDRIITINGFDPGGTQMAKRSKKGGKRACKFGVNKNTGACLKHKRRKRQK